MRSHRIGYADRPRVQRKSGHELRKEGLRQALQLPGITWPLPTELNARFELSGVRVTIESYPLKKAAYAYARITSGKGGL